MNVFASNIKGMQQSRYVVAKHSYIYFFTYICMKNKLLFMVKFDLKKSWEKCCFFFFIWYNRTDILYRRNFE